MHSLDMVCETDLSIMVVMYWGLHIPDSMLEGLALDRIVPHIAESSTE